MKRMSRDRRTKVAMCRRIFASFDNGHLSNHEDPKIFGVDQGVPTNDDVPKLQDSSRQLR